MNLSLSKTGDYAVRAALSLTLAYPDHRYRKIREVAAEMNLPLRYTPQVLGMLAKAGLAKAKAGRAGGYRLARAPADISLLQVVEAAEGELRGDRCTMSGGPCRWDAMCAVHPAWEAATEAVRASLESVKLADVAAVDKGLADGSLGVTGRAHRRADATGSDDVG